MEPLDILLLLALSAIWGSSFMFMRYLSPLVGPIATADLRLLIAGVALMLFFLVIGFKAEWRKNWKHFFVIGLLNSGIPFLLYSFAALSLPASIEVIFNSLSPMFGAVFSALWLKERLSTRKVSGLFLGICGVLLITSLEGLAASRSSAIAALACLLAPACYGLAGVYIARRAKGVKPMAIAGGSQLLAGVILAPLIAAAPPAMPVSLGVGGVIVAFALLCSAVAYLIYYRLIARVGPTKALTVTFLMPAFGMLWGAVILGERITWIMVAGVLVILAGTFLVAVSHRAAQKT
jgi:drug/metabolite transporter (DMT)-like permease